MHRALETTVSKNMMARLFPTHSSIRQKEIPVRDITFYNTNVAKNEEQKNAVLAVLAGTSGYAPVSSCL